LWRTSFKQSHRIEVHFFRCLPWFPRACTAHPHQRPRGTMLSTPAKLDQDEIPGQPRSAMVHHYSLGAVAELETDFRAATASTSPLAVGVSIGLAPVGSRIQTLALATPDKVFCLSLRHSPSPTQCKALRKLFSNIQHLAGFEFPYTIILLAHILGSHITGYDLSTLPLRSKSGDITTPGHFLYTKSESISSRRINERWDGDVRKNGEDPDGPAEPDYALRAWFTAMCVALFHYSLPTHFSH
jgi:hypothetical protein